VHSNWKVYSDWDALIDALNPNPGLQLGFSSFPDWSQPVDRLLDQVATRMDGFAVKCQVKSSAEVSHLS